MVIVQTGFNRSLFPSAVCRYYGPEFRRGVKPGAQPKCHWTKIKKFYMGKEPNPGAGPGYYFGAKSRRQVSFTTWPPEISDFSDVTVFTASTSDIG